MGRGRAATTLLGVLLARRSDEKIAQALRSAT